MGEWMLFERGTVPECATPQWYATRDRANHIGEPVHRGRLLRAADYARTAVKAYGMRSIVDLGCGDGGLMSVLALDETPAWGYDLQPSNVEAGRERGLDIRLGDVVEGSIQWGELAIATEIIEHLVNPHAFVKRIRSMADMVVASSPAVETDLRHYEHHLWAWDPVGYRRMFEQAGWRVEAHEQVGPFQVLLGRRQ